MQKKAIVFLICIFIVIFPFSISAATNNDISVVFNDVNKLTESFMDIGGRYVPGTVSKFASGSFRSVYRNVDIDNSVLALFSYEPSSDTYATVQSTYHYAIEFDLDYMLVKDSIKIQSGIDWQFVLFTDNFSGSSPVVSGDSSAYSISIPVKCTSKSVTGTVEHLRFDFDFYPPENYPGYNGSLEVLGWGLYLYGYSSTYSRIQLTVNNLSFKSYSPDEWQTKKIEEGFDSIESQVVKGMKEYAEIEKQEIQGSAGSAVSDVAEAIKDEYSAGLLASLNKLMSVMAYNGTEAEWTFPSIVLPEIPNVMESIKLNDEVPINFTEWVDKVPSKIMNIVRALTTVGLVLYSFKELWELVEYVISLNSKSGGGLRE